MTVPKGLRPIALLAVALLATAALTTVARVLVESQGFFVERSATLVVLGLGLAVATLLYARACTRALRHRANSWPLVITALIVAAPVILAILLPQNPAP